MVMAGLAAGAGEVASDPLYPLLLMLTKWDSSLNVSRLLKSISTCGCLGLIPFLLLRGAVEDGLAEDVAAHAVVAHKKVLVHFT